MLRDVSFSVQIDVWEDFLRTGLCPTYSPKLSTNHSEVVKNKPRLRKIRENRFQNEKISVFSPAFIFTDLF